MEQENKPKTSKVDLFLKIFICLDLVAIICLGIVMIVTKTTGNNNNNNNTNNNNNNTSLTGELIYEYQDDSIPGGKYEVSLNYDTGHVQITETRFCSAVDCPSTTTEYAGDLDADELEKIKTITSKDYDAGSLTDVLVSLIKSGILKSKSEVENEKYWLELYAEYDLDGDDVVTNKEFGNGQLNYIMP